MLLTKVPGAPVLLRDFYRATIPAAPTGNKQLWAREIYPCWGCGEIHGGSHGIKGEEDDGPCMVASRGASEQAGSWWAEGSDVCVRSSECYGACSGRSRAFYSKPLVKRSLEIALAIATSAAAIKAAEIRSSESGERQLKIRQVKRESERG